MFDGAALVVPFGFGFPNSGAYTQLDPDFVNVVTALHNLYTHVVAARVVDSGAIRSQPHLC